MKTSYRVLAASLGLGVALAASTTWNLPLINNAFAKTEYVGSRASIPHIVTSTPDANARNISVDQALSLKFSTPMDPASLTSSTLVLMGATGPVKANVQIDQNGQGVTVTPAQQLMPDAAYALYVYGAKAASGKAMPMVSLSFRTKTLDGSPSVFADASGLHQLTSGGSYGAMAGVSTTADHVLLPANKASFIKDGQWFPGQDNSNGHWRIGKPLPAMPAIGDLHQPIPDGATAVYGQILQVDDQPISNVEVSIGSKVTHTDTNGLFVLSDVPAGRQQLFVDGASVGYNQYSYGQLLIGVDVKAHKVSAMDQQIFLPKISARDRIHIASPTTQEVVLSHPDVPGLEVRIPAGTVIRDFKGRIVSDISMVPTPLDRAPYPVPQNFPSYFTLQPGGATIIGTTPEAAKGVQVVYPNYMHAAAGSKMNFWFYDPQEGWRTYGKGTVTADARSVMPDAGVSLYAQIGAGFDFGSSGPTKSPSDDPTPGEDPVDLSTGLFTYRHTDIRIDDVIPLEVDRAYHSGDTTVGAMGIATSLNYNIYLYSPDQSSDVLNLVQEDGSLVSFTRTSGNGPTGSWTSGVGHTKYFGATLTSVTSNADNPESYIITLKDGTQLHFDPWGGNYLNKIIDRFGNTVSINRSGAQIQSVQSPSGRYLQFQYDSSNRILTITDNIGRTVTYSYASPTDSHLINVEYTDQTSFTYGYDPSSGNMQTV